MAGQVKVNQVQLGDSATATQNFVWQTNVDGTAKLARGNVGATMQDILTVDAAGKVEFPQDNKTWTVVTGSRVFGTVYTNDTGHDLSIRVRCSLPSSSVTLQCSCQGVVLLGSTILNTAAGAETWLIPKGATYNVNYSAGSGGSIIWQELR